MTGPAAPGTAAPGTAAPALVARPADEDAAPPGWDGAGPASSWADLGRALTGGDPVEIALGAAAAGLDTLGAVLHPLDALLEAGVGWLIEHVAFLHEPLDALAGDPTQIVAQARTWQNVAAELRAAAADQRAAAVPGWAGAAGDSYRAAAAELTATLDRVADRATALGTLVLVTGAGVGTVRTAVRDAIAEFLALVVQYVLAATALAALTAGGSVGTAVATVVVRAVEVAQDIARRAAELLDVLAAAGGAAARIGDGMQQAVDAVRVAGPGLRGAGDDAERAAETWHLSLLVEAGSQLAGSTAVESR